MTKTLDRYGWENRNAGMASKLQPVFLNASSFDWALRHIQRFGDTDIFPVPFEFDAYSTVWGEVRKYLMGIDVANVEISGIWKMMVPKHTQGFRAAAQLHPIDALLYTALIYENALEIESYRAPVERRIACAYRLDIDKDGRFFGKGTGWKDFNEVSEELLAKGGFTHVLCADIADFYNQVSHHRTQNALEDAHINANISQVVERFLGNLNANHHSRGIPVGPSVSILLAEACLADVDNFIRRNYTHTRYVDDFRIFCHSEEHALRALHDLSDYLYTAHRLPLQSSKTKILAASEFRLIELNDPEQDEMRQHEKRLKELVEELTVFEEGEYGEWVERIEGDVDNARIAHDALAELFDQVIGQRVFPLGLARHVIRRAATLRCRKIMPQLLANLESFTPVLRDVMRYLVKVAPKNDGAPISEALMRLLNDSIYRSLPFVQLWVFEVFRQIPHLANGETVMQFAEKSDPLIRDRILASMALTYKIVDWVRWKKETWSGSSPWAQRAIIWASSVLPKDERVHWLQSIRNHPDRSVGFIADAAFCRRSG